MKRFIILLTISVIISMSLTFVFWIEPPLPDDPIRKQYADVFTRFGLHAEDVYRQFDDASGLDILANYGSEGLRILLQYHDVIVQLQPHLDIESLVSLCRADAELLTEFMRIFQPEVVADLYNKFGLGGLRFALDDPERVFLMQEYGQPLVDLARVKGPIMFDLIRVYSPEFLELYYDDALFNAIQLVGLEGLLAVQAYPGMASAIFIHFGQEPQLARALQTYGYQQVIPVLYHVYQTQEIASLQERMTEASEADALQNADPAQRQYDNARQALAQINRKGQTFLRQFSVAPDGTVTRLPVVALTNVVEELVLGDAQSPALSPNDPAGSGCEHLLAVLDILGLLPSGARLTKYMNCASVRNGLATATSQAGVEGLLALDQEDGVVDTYGPDVVPFVAHYGKDGLRLVQETEGAILSFAAIYGPEIVDYALLYGPDVLTMLDEFGQEALDAIRVTQGVIIPYIIPYREKIFHVLRHPEGQALIGLAAVFGERIFDDTLQYPDDFPRLLFKYGRTALTALKRYNVTIVAAARQYGDDVLFYAGRYGDPAFQLIRRGKIGITLLRVLPETKLRDDQFLSKSFPMLLMNLLVTSPRALHTYIGQLGIQYIPVQARYIQVAFWMLTIVCAFLALGWMYDLFRRIFWIA